MTKMQLETFVCLAKTLNYAKTARIMFLSQPAITQQIKALEAELGAGLFIRSTRKVQLTAAGEVFYADCQDILSRLENTVVKLRRCDACFRESLRVNCGDLLSLSRMDEVLRRFAARMPHIHLYLDYDGDAVSSVKRFLEGKADVAFGARHAMLDKEALGFHMLRKGRFQCVMPSGSPLACQESVGWKDFSGENLILMEKEYCPPELQEIQEELGKACQESVAYYSSSVLASIKMIQAGLGIAVMPDFACPDCEGICLRPVRDVEELEYGIFWKKKESSAKIQCFVECVGEAMA